MGERLVECVPNISEGRDRELIGRLIDALKAVSGVQVLHVDSGWDANRTVVTFVGSPERVLEGAKALVERASVLIDISKHSGAHPRIGAVDVCPFIPLRNVDHQVCIELAESLGAYCSESLNLPVFLYSLAAKSNRTKRLWQLRRDGIAGLNQRLERGEIAPDYGPNSISSTFGALVAGARDMMIAFNVSLDDGDLKTARQIAAMLRFNPKGRGQRGIPKDLDQWVGIPGLQAIGWSLPKLGVNQVSMNLLSPGTGTMFHAYRAVEKWAEHLGCAVSGAEMIGLALEEYFVDAGALFANEAGLQIQGKEELIELAYKQMNLNHLTSERREVRTIESLLNAGRTQWIWK